jgi:hypothetical protein
MPSTNQSNQSKGDYESQAERFIQSDMDIGPLVRGMQDKARCEHWIKEADRLNATQEKKALTERLWQLS